MHLPPLLALLFLLTTVLACIVFEATAPFDDNQPYLASITHNGILTCWLSMSYTRHMHIQKHTPVLRDQDGHNERHGSEGAMEWEFQPWEFECLDGFEARAMIGTCFLSSPACSFVIHEWVVSLVSW